MNMKKAKGFLGAFIIDFAIAVFVVLAVFIFVYCFKIHITQAMVDYYMWNKEFDIPMALFSVDVKEVGSPKIESSAVFLSRLYYATVLGENKDELKKQLNTILDRWSQGVNQYTLTFGEIAFTNEVQCVCKSTKDLEGWLYGKCTGCKSTTEGKSCWARDYGDISVGQIIEYENNVEVTKSYSCWGSTKLTNIGPYPLPVVYNGTQRILTLNFQVLGG